MKEYGYPSASFKASDRRNFWGEGNRVSFFGTLLPPGPCTESLQS
jgi:hypothetical protein